MEVTAQVRQLLDNLQLPRRITTYATFNDRRLNIFAVVCCEKDMDIDMLIAGFADIEILVLFLFHEIIPHCEIQTAATERHTVR